MRIAIAMANVVDGGGRSMGATKCMISSPLARRMQRFRSADPHLFAVSKSRIAGIVRHGGVPLLARLQTQPRFANITEFSASKHLPVRILDAIVVFIIRIGSKMKHIVVIA